MSYYVLMLPKIANLYDTSVKIGIQCSLMIKIVIKWLNKCARLVWGILARRKVLFQNCSEYKTRVIDAFTVSLGPGTDDPTIKNVNLKKII